MPGRLPAPGREELAQRFAAARDDRSLVVLEGFHALKHALRFGARVELAVTSEDVGALARELAPDLEAALAPLVREIPRDELRALVPREPHTRVLAIAHRPPPAAIADEGPVVALEDPRHMGNVGAVVRVAAAAGAAGVLTSGAADPWHPAALRGSAGLHFALPVTRVNEIEPLGGRPLVALDPEGDPHVEFDPRATLVFGSERHGLSPELLARADARLRIPMRPGVSSLNLATAVAAVLFRSTRRA